jgi:hypothetical protein
MQRHAPWGLSVALLVALVASVALLSDPAPRGSSPERTVYSAIHALKAKNFGRFCSYLSDDLRSGGGMACSDAQAGGWAVNAVLGGIDVFQNATVIPGSRVDVDDDTVEFGVVLPRLPDPVYVITVKKQESGNWRITDIRRKNP